MYFTSVALENFVFSSFSLSLPPFTSSRSHAPVCRPQNTSVCTLKSSPSVLAKRPHGKAGTHGDVLNVHMEIFSVPHLTPTCHAAHTTTPNTRHTKHTSHQTYTTYTMTTITTTQGSCRLLHFVLAIFVVPLDVDHGCWHRYGLRTAEETATAPSVASPRADDRRYGPG